MTTLTFGRGVTSPYGWQVELGEDPIESARVKLAGHTELEAWLSVSTYEGSYKVKKAWQSAAGVGVDVDWHNEDGEHALVPPDVRAAVEAKLQAQQIPGTVLHMTPRGLRVLYLYSHQLEDLDLHERCMSTAIEELEHCFVPPEEFGPIPHFAVDAAASRDIARLLWAPCALVDGHQRAAELYRGPSGLIDPEAFAAPPEEPEPAPRLHVVPDLSREHAGAQAYRETALRNAVARLASAREGGRYDAVNAEAYKLAQVGVDPSEARGPLLEVALSTGLPRREALKALRTGFTDGAQHQTPIPDRPAPPKARTSPPDPPPDDTPPVGEHSEPPSGGGSDAGGGAGRGDSKGPGFAQIALKRRFAALHSGSLRYVHGLGQWLLWDHTRWAPDEVGEVQEMAERLCWQTACDADSPSTREKLAGQGYVRAVQSLAQTDKRLRVRPEQLDADPWLLGTPEGVLDLRTGEMRKARREDLITKQIGTKRGSGCPLWLEFLQWFTRDDAQIERLLQQAVGYALTGLTREQVLLFFWGTGGNGKSRFFSVIHALLGSYAESSAIQSWLRMQRPVSNEDLVPFAGARLVTADEPEIGARWDDGRLKLTTGESEIRCRPNHGAAWLHYTPRFKLWLSGNNRPKLATSDPGIRRRFRLIPCHAVPQVVDTELLPKLLQELPGILSWAIEGCLDWQSNGLITPAAVREASEAYMDEADPVEEWIASSVEKDPQGFELTRDLYKSWAAFANDRGYTIYDAGWLGRALSDKQYDRAQRRIGRQVLRGFKGLTLPVFNPPHPAAGG